MKQIRNIKNEKDYGSEKLLQTALEHTRNSYQQNKQTLTKMLEPEAA